MVPEDKYEEIGLAPHEVRYFDLFNLIQKNDIELDEIYKRDKYEYQLALNRNAILKIEKYLIEEKKRYLKGFYKRCEAQYSAIV